jgi:hypothetical protein
MHEGVGKNLKLVTRQTNRDEARLRQAGLIFIGLEK